jgi:hypothetical protein
MTIKKPGTSKNWGGKRKGSGRPKNSPKSFSDKLKTDVMKELERRAKEGDTYGKLLVDLAFEKEEVHSLRGIALKLIAEVLVVKESKHTLEKEKFPTPTIYLPATRDSEEERKLLAERGYFRQEDLERIN